MSTRGICLVAALLSACSSDTTAPHQPSGAPFSIIAGTGQSDTISAELTTALIVAVARVNGDTALPVVTFTALNDSGPAGLQPGVLLQGFEQYPPSTSSVYEAVDDQYHAGVTVTLGSNVGIARVAVQVTNVAMVDTVSFTVKPGAATHLMIVPRDTAIYVGGSDAVHVTTLDRFGNPRSDPVSFGAPIGPVSATNTAGTFTGQAIGRVVVPVAFNAIRDTALISIVPQGRIAASDGTHIVELNLDGTSQRTILTMAASALEWSPDASLIVFNGATLTDTLGNWRLAATLPPGGNYFALGQFSRDGVWIYNTMVDDDQIGWTWRVEVSDSTTAASLNLEGYGQPSPSPDGAQLAVIGGGDEGLLILNLSNHSLISTGAGYAGTPMWAPAGKTIAYLSGTGASSLGLGSFGSIGLVNSDGTNQHILSGPGALYNAGISWSPDLQWVIAQNATTGNLDLLEVSSGLTLPLAFTHGLGFPAWRPQ